MYYEGTMIRPLAILAVSLLACTTRQAQSTKEDEVRLRATVQAVVPLTDFSGTVTPIGVDPQFALTVRVESVVPDDTHFRAGKVITLAIHSPSLLFGARPIKGKTYNFVLHREIRDGKTGFYFLNLAT